VVIFCECLLVALRTYSLRFLPSFRFPCLPVNVIARIPSLSPVTNIPLPATDFFGNVRTVIHHKWQSHWNLYPNNKLYKIYPDVSTLPLLPNTFSRREQTALNSLMLGHSHLTQLSS